MKSTITFKFIHKQPLTVTKPVNLSILKNHKSFVDFAKQQLTAEETKELSLVTADLIDISNATEFNLVPNWFLTCKGKFKFERGRYQG